MSLSSFLASHDRENFFTNTQRHRVVRPRGSSPDSYSCVSLTRSFQAYEILTRTTYGKRKRSQVGVDRLLSEDVFKTAFPLHEVRFCYFIK